MTCSREDVCEAPRGAFLLSVDKGNRGRSQYCSDKDVRPVTVEGQKCG